MIITLMTHNAKSMPNTLISHKLAAGSLSSASIASQINDSAGITCKVASHEVICERKRSGRCEDGSVPPWHWHPGSCKGWQFYLHNTHEFPAFGCVGTLEVNSTCYTWRKPTLDLYPCFQGHPNDLRFSEGWRLPSQTATTWEVNLPELEELCFCKEFAFWCILYLCKLETKQPFPYHLLEVSGRLREHLDFQYSHATLKSDPM